VARLIQNGISITNPGSSSNFPYSTQGRTLKGRKGSIAKMMKMQVKKIEGGDSFDSHSLLSASHKNMTNDKLKYMINNK